MAVAPLFLIALLVAFAPSATADIKLCADAVCASCTPAAMTLNTCESAAGGSVRYECANNVIRQMTWTSGDCSGTGVTATVDARVNGTCFATGATSLLVTCPAPETPAPTPIPTTPSTPAPSAAASTVSIKACSDETCASNCASANVPANTCVTTEIGTFIVTCSGDGANATYTEFGSSDAACGRAPVTVHQFSQAGVTCRTIGGLSVSVACSSGSIVAATFAAALLALALLI